MENNNNNMQQKHHHHQPQQQVSIYPSNNNNNNNYENMLSCEPISSSTSSSFESLSPVYSQPDINTIYQQRIYESSPNVIHYNHHYINNNVSSSTPTLTYQQQMQQYFAYHNNPSLSMSPSQHNKAYGTASICQTPEGYRYINSSYNQNTTANNSTSIDSNYFSKSSISSLSTESNNYNHSVSYSHKTNESNNVTPQVKQTCKSFMIDSILNDNTNQKIKVKSQQSCNDQANDDDEQEHEPEHKTRSKSGGKNSKRIRTIFTQEQLDRLEIEFARQQYMVGTERYYLANELNLSEAQVKIWFQNRRIKWRKTNFDQQRTGQQQNDNKFNNSHLQEYRQLHSPLSVSGDSITE